MNIICASSLALGREIFSTLGEVTVMAERDIDAAAVRDADALIIRSKVRVNRELLEGSRVSFVGTATAGTDHLDLPWLEERGIAWTAAPGCNARSVAEYVVAALLRLAVRHHFALDGKCLALVGVGHVGRRLADLAPMLGLKVLLNDPPRHAAEGLATLRPLDEILPQADLVSLHVPLTLAGDYATRHLVDCRFLSALKPGCLFVNASRGEVVDEESLLLARDRGYISRAVLDVFEHEPRLRREVAAQADLVSPHIAGYSYEGRVNGTHLCYEEAAGSSRRRRCGGPPRPTGRSARRSRWTPGGCCPRRRWMRWCARPTTLRWTTPRCGPAWWRTTWSAAATSRNCAPSTPTATSSAPGRWS